MEEEEQQQQQWALRKAMRGKGKWRWRGVGGNAEVGASPIDDVASNEGKAMRGERGIWRLKRAK